MLPKITLGDVRRTKREFQNLISLEGSWRITLDKKLENMNMFLIPSRNGKFHNIWYQKDYKRKMKRRW